MVWILLNFILQSWVIIWKFLKDFVLSLCISASPLTYCPLSKCCVLFTFCIVNSDGFNYSRNSVEQNLSRILFLECFQINKYHFFVWLIFAKQMLLVLLAMNEIDIIHALLEFIYRLLYWPKVLEKQSGILISYEEIEQNSVMEKCRTVDKHERCWIYLSEVVTS